MIIGTARVGILLLFCPISKTRQLTKSGVAGALIADSLMRKGMIHTILEAGPRTGRIDAVLKYLNTFIKIPECAYPLSPEIHYSVSNDHKI